MKSKIIIIPNPKALIPVAQIPIDDNHFQPTSSFKINTEISSLQVYKCSEKEIQETTWSTIASKTTQFLEVTLNKQLKDMC